jgi:hypothetical protein
MALKKEERKTFAVQEACSATEDGLNEDSFLVSLHNLKQEDDILSEQKEKLEALLQQLETKAKEEYEKEKRKVDRLNSEVSVLKRKCEKFANFINSESTLGRSQADP